MTDGASRLADLIPFAGRVAVGDGAGHPAEIWPIVVDLLHQRPDVTALLGWCLQTPERIDELGAARVRTVISGFGMRRPIDAGRVGFVPVRLSSVPGLLQGPLRCDVLVTTLRPASGGFAFSTEVSWQRAAVAAGARVVAVVRENAPACESGPLLASDQVLVLAEGDRAPASLAREQPTPEQQAVAERVASLVPEGVRVQVGPGGLGAAIYAALRRPVFVDSGIVNDSVMELDQRGLLQGSPFGPYVVGTDDLYQWAPGRVTIRGVETTHDPARLSTGRPLYAINTGLEIDLDGQVNAETVARTWVGGIGGQPDFAASAAISPDGLSIMALTVLARGKPTLVERLAGPVTTPGHDVDVVVTELGTADLRGLSRTERRVALAGIWGADAP